MSVEKKMSKLHELLCEELTKRLTGEEPATSAELNVIRQFLKDNDITALAVDDSPLADLISQLPEEFRQGKVQ